MNISNGSNGSAPSPDLRGMNVSLPMSRRDAVRVSLFSTAGLLLAGPSAARGEGTPTAEVAGQGGQAPALLPAKAKSVIQVFLWGGMSHIDTWDPKPDAGYDYMGELATAIPTNVDGMRLGQLVLCRSVRNTEYESGDFVRRLAHCIHISA